MLFPVKHNPYSPVSADSTLFYKFFIFTFCHFNLFFTDFTNTFDSWWINASPLFMGKDYSRISIRINMLTGFIVTHNRYDVPLYKILYILRCRMDNIHPKYLHHKQRNGLKKSEYLKYLFQNRRYLPYYHSLSCPNPF